MESHSEDSVEEKNDPGVALGAFFNSFGELDTHSRIVLEEFLDAIILEKK